MPKVFRFLLLNIQTHLFLVLVDRKLFDTRKYKHLYSLKPNQILNIWMIFKIELWTSIKNTLKEIGSEWGTQHNEYDDIRNDKYIYKQYIWAYSVENIQARRNNQSITQNNLCFFIIRNSLSIETRAR